MLEIAQNESDTYSNYNYHFLETTTGKILNRGDTGNTGLGYPVSIDGRPTFFSYAASHCVNGSTPCVIVGPWQNIHGNAALQFNGYDFSGDHEPDINGPLYLLTGDPFRLHERKCNLAFKPPRAATRVLSAAAPE